MNNESKTVNADGPGDSRPDDRERISLSGLAHSKQSRMCHSCKWIAMNTSPISKGWLTCIADSKHFPNADKCQFYDFTAEPALMESIMRSHDEMFLMANEIKETYFAIFAKYRLLAAKFKTANRIIDHATKKFPFAMNQIQLEVNASKQALANTKEGQSND